MLWWKKIQDALRVERRSPNVASGREAGGDGGAGLGSLPGRQSADVSPKKWIGESKVKGQRAF